MPRDRARARHEPQLFGYNELHVRRVELEHVPGAQHRRLLGARAHQLRVRRLLSGSRGPSRARPAGTWSYAAARTPRMRWPRILGWPGTVNRERTNEGV